MMKKTLFAIVITISTILTLCATAFAAENAQFKTEMINALENYETVVDVADCNASVEDAVETFKNLLASNNSYYYVANKFSYTYDANRNVKTFTVGYKLSADEINAQKTAMNTEIAKITALVTPEMTTEQKIEAVHNYFIANYNYDTTYTYRTAYDILVNKTGVCQAYSNAFEDVMDALGIPCKIVASDAMNHCWNQVMVDGQWLNVDVTWDDPIVNGSNTNTTPYYDYFLKTDAEISADHYAWN